MTNQIIMKDARKGREGGKGWRGEGMGEVIQLRNVVFARGAGFSAGGLLVPNEILMYVMERYKEV